MIPFSQPLLPAIFLRRDNRFRAAVSIDGREASARVANPGRLSELFVPGRPCYVTAANGPGRKTCFDLRLIAHAGTLISLDTHLPNALFEDALIRGVVALPGCSAGRVAWQREVRLGRSRIDFLLLPGEGRRYWLETKSVTLVEDGIALFPDAPTTRCVRHLEELMAAVTAGDRATLTFVVQRPDACAVASHPTADPAFAAAMRRAAATGVNLQAYTCRVETTGVEILGEIPVRIER